MAASGEQVQKHTLLCQLFLLSSLPTFLILRYVIIAPFGRHVPSKQLHSKSKYRWWFGPMFDARISWLLFESPNLMWAWYCCWYWCDPKIFFLESSTKSGIFISLNDNNLQISTNFILVALFVLHYINRSIIYPLRMNSNTQKVPLVVSFAGSLVTTLNGYLQCFYLVQIEKFSTLSMPPSSLHDIQCFSGICIFFVGMSINIKSDAVLRNLRKKGKGDRQQQRYFIPQSAFFKYVSCPNLGGEIVEWLGFSVASGFSLPSVAFFVYTAGNLIPRAMSHHEWYQRKFDNYPKERKWAAIPFVV